MLNKILTLILVFQLTLPCVAKSVKNPPSDVWIALSPLVLNLLPSNYSNLLKVKNMLWESNEIYLNLPEKNLSFLGSFVHQNLKRCGGFRVLTLPPNQASQFAINKSMPDIEFGEFWPNELDPFINADYSLTKGNEVNEWFEATSEIYLNSIISKLSSYHTRYYNSPEGIASQKWIGSEWEKLSKDRSDMSVTYFKHQKFEQPSLILTITGSDEAKKNKIIILGGHGDSINADDPEKGLRSPGADDNAAGIAVISDIIKLIVEKNYRPKHTIEFIAYAAEEVGLQGSNELAELYHKNQKQVMGVMQFDGVNFTGKTFDLALIADGTNKDQTLFVAKLVDEYLKVNWTWEKCGYACSDHYSWHVQGYRTSFPVEAISTEQNPFIHTSEDTFEKSSFNSKKANLFEKLGIAYLLELDK